ncbi:MAG: hypothetical protein Athens041674_44 [Parcubacteria group bacterium Athens0416_74]|nr:MAG: hypothetical protein Athens041674_44 [Parcubacteria group bacterium Athens0416_74]
MSPIAYGIINAVMPGLAYLILRKREMFGLLLVIGDVTAFALGFVEPIPLLVETPMFGSSALSMILSVVSFLCFSGAFAVDAYNLAQQSQK